MLTTLLATRSRPFAVDVIVGRTILLPPRCRCRHRSTAAIRIEPLRSTPSFRAIGSGVVVASSSSSSASMSSSSRAASPTSKQEDEGEEHVVILGTGIAGLSTAHYLLKTNNHAAEQPQRHNKKVKVTLLDQHPGVALGGGSRKNGQMLCPSHYERWTASPLLLGKDAVLPMLIKGWYGGGGQRDDNVPSFMEVDWRVLQDPQLWRFAFHFFYRRLLESKQRLAGSKVHTNRDIMMYSMACLDDIDDGIIQSLNYGRYALGSTHITEEGGRIVATEDSSGDIGLFCHGLYQRLIETYGNNNDDSGERDNKRIEFKFNEMVDGLEVENGMIRAVTTRCIDTDEVSKHHGTKFVIALGTASAELCRTINVPCPVYPVKGYLVTITSYVDIPYNVELPGKFFASPMGPVVANDTTKGSTTKSRYQYRLSGCADFVPPSRRDVIDPARVNAVLAAAHTEFPDLEVVTNNDDEGLADCCDRPVAADDTPLIGATSRYSNLFLCTGHGSKGWSMGPGSGKMLADLMLGRPCDIESSPYSPKRFDLLLPFVS